MNINSVHASLHELLGAVFGRSLCGAGVDDFAEPIESVLGEGNKEVGSEFG